MKREILTNQMDSFLLFLYEGMKI